MRVRKNNTSMSMKHILSIFVLINVFTVSSQIKGVVSDAAGSPLEYVNVALFSLPDSLLVDGAVTDSLGVFSISCDGIGKSFLQVSMLGYETQRLVTQAYHNIIMLQSSEYLNEIIIEGERPPLKVEHGKLVYHMPSLLRSKPVTNAFDALKQIPGVIEQDENLTLIGASGMTVLLNGKKTSMSYGQLMELLRSMPISRVENVEIMYSAPPQYNIRGAAINVVLKQTADNGMQNVWQGEIAGEYQQLTRAGVNGRVSLLYLGKNFTFDVLYSDRYTSSENREEKINNHTVNNVLHDIKEQNKGINRGNSHNVRTAMSAVFANKGKIDIAYTGRFNNSKSHRMADIIIDDLDVNSEMRVKGPYSLNNVKVDYISHFGLSAGIDYTNYNDESNQNLINTVLSQSTIPEKYTSDTQQNINKVFAYVNQKHAISEGFNINYGINYSYAASRNFSEAYRNDDLYDASTFKSRQYEDIWNVFAGFSKSFSKQFSLQGSFAAEYYKTVEEKNAKRETLWDGIAYFPTLGVTYMPSMKHIFQFSLSSDKQYPQYWTLNSTVYHLNAYSEVHGNPQLKPFRSYNTRLNYIFNRKYILMAYLNYLPDYFTQMMYQSPDELKMIIRHNNMNYQRMIGVAAIAPFKIGKAYESKLTVNGIRITHKMDDFYDIPFDRSKWFSQLKWDNDFKLYSKPKVTLNLLGVYTTPAIQGIMDLSRSYYVSGGLTLSFSRDRAKFVFNAADIFNTRMPSVKIDYKGQKSTMKTYQDTRMFSLSFIYRFGGFKDRKNTEIDTSRYGM